MITKFNHINVGNPSGVFNRIAYDCIELAKEHRCYVVWEYEGVPLWIRSKSTLLSIQQQFNELNYMMDN